MEMTKFNLDNSNRHINKSFMTTQALSNPTERLKVIMNHNLCRYSDNSQEKKLNQSPEIAPDSLKSKFVG